MARARLSLTFEPVLLLARLEAPIPHDSPLLDHRAQDPPTVDLLADALDR